MAEVVVRDALVGDLASLLGLYGELADRPSAGPGELEDSRPLIEAILADPDRRLLVATVAEEVLGTADLLIAANLTHHGKPWAMVENVIVAERARRGGVGRALMGRLIELAAAAGCYKVQLLSGRQRVQAHAFYRDLGMESFAEGFKLYLDGSGPESPQAA
jgi:GNAT superfamily N-acetyltransferase